MQRALRRLVWLLGWLRRLGGHVEREHVTHLKGLMACEACVVEPATIVVPSNLRAGGVYLCDWCYRRWRRANQRMDIPKTRKPTKRGDPGGRAA